ncbi:MAG: hypothetical protein M1817_002298 [Caeruleum heppii]|nr:MAG: hypothetical protein M1817_003518 [Caeruleum heppii]KAI9673661.1 MAG: hypothetical protein M1817_002298 [Caeruleum heppii]
MTKKEMSLMARKFLAAQNGSPVFSLRSSTPEVPYGSYEKPVYFFYGSLSDPATLAKVLRRSDMPELLPAKTLRYTIKLWGPYPALLIDFAEYEDAEAPIVYGMAYQVQSFEEEEWLKEHETNHYRSEYCRIHLEDGKEVPGRTFVWNADEAILTEGTFDLPQFLKARSQWKG